MVDTRMLDELEQQHRQVEAVFAELEEAEGTEEQRRLVDELAGLLCPHMDVEEAEVYPELRRIEEEMSEEAEIEHQLARTGLEQLRSVIGAPGFGAAVAMLQAGIQHHVEEEEQQAFPKLRRALQGPFDVEGMTKDELYELAKEQGVDGRSSMTRDELARAVQA